MIARTSEERRIIAERVLASWQRCPHLRLGQFLDNVRVTSIHCQDMFHIVDERLAEACERYADTYRGSP